MLSLACMWKTLLHWPVAARMFLLAVVASLRRRRR